LYFVPEDTENISSTLIRERMEKGEPIDDLTFPGVSAYLLENKADLSLGRALD
jgi:nicotinic acid mononucleotide adenylyltransferase